MISVNDFAYPLAAIVAGLAFVIQLWRMPRYRGDPACTALTASLGFLAAVFFLSVPVVWKWLGESTGVPNIAGVTAQALVIVFAVSQQAFILYWSEDRSRARKKTLWWLSAAAIVIAVMYALFFAIPNPGERTRDFAVTYAGFPIYSIYLVLYLTTFTVVRVNVIRLALRYAPHAGDVWLRRGLRLIAAGSMLGLVYVGVRVSAVVASSAGLDPRHWEVLAQIGAALGGILEVVGLTAAMLWGPRLSIVRQWGNSRYHFHKLRHCGRRFTTPSPISHWKSRDQGSLNGWWSGTYVFC